MAIGSKPKLSAFDNAIGGNGMVVASGIGAAVTVLLLCFAGRYGYMADELYFLACAKHPAWGYVDLPPLLPWITATVTHVFGSSLLAIRFYPAVAAGLTVVVSARLAAELGGKRFSVTTTAVLVAISPVFLAFGHILSTNALDPLLWVASVLVLVRIARTGAERLWVAYGGIVGLALLNKYTLAFYLAALAVGFLATDWHKWFLNRWFWAGIGFALLMVLPNILWQATRGFPFLQLQHNISANQRNVVLPPLQFVFAQAFLVNLLSFAFVILGAVFVFTPAMKRFRALGWTFVVYMLLMYGLHAKDYLIAPVYPMMLAFGAVAAERWFGGVWARRAVVAYTGAAWVLMALLLPSVVPVLSVENFERYYRRLPLHRTEAERNSHTELPDYYSDNFGWRETAELVAQYYNALPAEQRKKTAILGNFYGEAGAIDQFGSALGLPNALSGHHSYWYWGTHGYTGESVIFLDFSLNYLQRHCGSVTLVAERHFPWARPNINVPIYHCRELDYNLSERWDSFRHFD